MLKLRRFRPKFTPDLQLTPGHENSATTSRPRFRPVVVLVATLLFIGVGYTVARSSATVDPIIVVGGDIAGLPGCSPSTGTNLSCNHGRTADLIDTINTATPTPLAAVLTVGDNQYENGCLADYEQSYDVTWGRFRNITYPTPGNHDYRTAPGCVPAQNYFPYYNSTNPAYRTGRNTALPGGVTEYYSYNIGDWHFVALNSEISASASSAQLTWLRNDLTTFRASNPTKCIAAYWHRPLFSSGQDYGSGHGGSTSYRPFWDALDDAQTTLVFNGHDHNYERFLPQTLNGVADPVNGITQFVLGNGGFYIYRFSTSPGSVPNSAKVNTVGVQGVLKLTLHPTSFDYEFKTASINPSTATFTDSGTQSCVGATVNPPDTANPTYVDISAPATPLSGTVTLSSMASDDVGVTRVDFYQNGTNLIGSSTNRISGTAQSGTWTLPWNTTGVANASYSLTARAFDAAGNSLTSSAITRAVDNGAPTVPTDQVHYTITGPTSVSFDWRGSATTINYGPTTSYGSSATAAGPVVVKEDGSNVPITPNSGPGPWREARITGLTPGTTYNYSIGGTANQTFKTAPAAGTADFTAIVNGDMGNPLGFSKSQPIANLMRDANPDLVLGVGDYSYANSNPTGGYVDAFFGDIALGANNGIQAFSLRTPFFPAWGNHEIDHANDGGTCTGGDNLTNYKGRFDLPNPKEDVLDNTYCYAGGGEDWHWFDYGNTRFIAFPEPWSDNWAGWNTKVSPIMLAAQNNPNIKYIVTYGHRPAWSTGSHASETPLANITRDLHASYSKFVLQLNGHSHNYERSNPTLTNGVTYVTAGTGGGGLANGSCANGWSQYAGSCNQPAWSVVRKMRYGYTKLTFGATAITGQFICGPAGGATITDTCTQGAVVDSFSIVAPGGGGGDTTPPTVNLTAPANGAIVSGTTAVTATASDNVAVARVEFFDGTTSLGIDNSAPYSASWNTTTAANGSSHIIKAVATDTATPALSTDSNIATVTVNNGCTALPTTNGQVTMTVTVPSAGTYRVWSRIMAPDSTNNSYYLTIDSTTCGAVVGNIDGATAIPANTWKWVDYKDANSSTKVDVSLTAGTHTLVLTGKEAGLKVDRLLLLSPTDNCLTAQPNGNGDNCTIDPDTTQPTVNSLTVPTSSPQQTVNITADATDNAGGTGVTKVDFYVDDVLRATDNTPPTPYSFAWNATTVTPGSHVIKAIATDGANLASAPVSRTITINDSTAPTGVALTAPTGTLSGTVTLSSTASDNVGVTRVEFYVGTTLLTPADTTAPYTQSWDTRTVANGTYSLTSKAYDAANNGPTVSSPVSVNVNNDTTAPNPPASLTATATSSTSVSLSWPAATDNAGGTGIGGYNVSRRTGTNSFAVIAQVTTTSYNDIDDAGSPVAASTTYDYVVSAFDMATPPNTSGSSPMASATTPNAPDTTAPTVPTGLSATTVSSNRIDLTWNASTDTGGSGLAGYKLRRYIGSTPTGTPTIITLPPSANLGYGDATLSPSTTYTYTVSAFDGATPPNESAASGPISRTTLGLSPTVSLTAPINNANVLGTITLTATASDDVAVTRVGFYVDSTLVGTSYAPVTGNTGSGTWEFSWDTASVSNGTHTLKAKAFDVRTNSPGVSALVNITVNNDLTPPTPPANFTAAATDPTHVSMSWDASTDNVAVTGYNVYRNGIVITPSSFNGLSFIDSTVSVNSTYTYQVTAKDSSVAVEHGNESGFSESITLTVPVTGDVDAPSRPTLLSATSPDSTHVNLSWNASVDNVGVTQYVIQRTEGTNVTNVGASSTTSFVDSTVQPNTTYSYVIFAQDAVPNTSAASDSVSITTAAPPCLDVPSAPTGLIANAPSSTQVNLSWEASSSPCGVIGYRVKRGSLTLARYVTRLSYGDAYATADTTYTYKVTAFNANGSSIQTTIDITTPPPPPPPSGGAVGNSGFETDLIGWKVDESATGGTLERVAGGHSGSFSAKLARVSGATASVTLNDSPNWVTTIPASTSCTATAWVKGSRVNMVAKIRLREYQGSTNRGSTVSQITLPDLNWHPISVTAPVFAAGDTMDLNVYGMSMVTGDNLQIDDVTEVCQ